MGHERAEHDQMRKRVLGCLLGGAVGDLIGGPFDRRLRTEIHRRNGGPVTGPTETSRIGDDTQLTLFTVEGLLRAELRWLSKGICHPPGVVWNAYRRWGLTQGLKFPPDAWIDHDAWLHQHPEMLGKGNASPRCLEVVGRGEPGSVDRRPNRSDGSGAIMRVAAVGLRFDGREAASMAAEVAALTHGGDRALAASSAFAVMVAALRRGESLTRGLEEAVDVVGNQPGGEVLAPALERACVLARTRPGDPGALHELGAGRTSLSALLHAVYAVSCTNLFEDAVQVAVDQDGTSATSAALAGQLAGTRDGHEAIPVTWRDATGIEAIVTELVDDWLVAQGSASVGYGDDGSAAGLMSKHEPW
jgi:ADP-ribosylglycohydrolase